MGGSLKRPPVAAIVPWISSDRIRLGDHYGFGCDDYDDDDDDYDDDDDDYDDDIFGQNKNRCEVDGDYGNESPSLFPPHFASVASRSFSLSLSS